MNGMSNSSIGMGLTGSLGIIFIILKITNNIDWSWWYVTLPFWGGLVIILVLLVIFVLISIIVDR